MYRSIAEGSFSGWNLVNHAACPKYGPCPVASQICGLFKMVPKLLMYTGNLKNQPLDGQISLMEVLVRYLVVLVVLLDQVKDDGP